MSLSVGSSLQRALQDLPNSINVVILVLVIPLALPPLPTLVAGLVSRQDAFSQLPLPLAHGVNVLVYGAGCHELVHTHVAQLADAMRAVLRLCKR